MKLLTFSLKCDTIKIWRLFRASRIFLIGGIKTMGNPENTGAPAPAPVTQGDPLASHISTGPVELSDDTGKKLTLNGLNFELNPGTSIVLACCKGGFKIGLTKEP